MTGEEDEQALLRRQLDRERRARREAEEIAERTTRSLFDRQRELELQAQVARAANESDGSAEGLERILEALCELGGWQLAQLYLTAEDGESLRPTEIWFSPEPVRFGEFRAASTESRYEVGRGLPGLVLRSGEPLVIPDVLEDHRFFRQEAARASAIRGAFAFPASSGGRTFAVVELFATSTVHEDEAMIETAVSIGSQVGRLVERERSERTIAELRKALDSARR